MRVLIIQHFGELGGGARSAIDIAKMIKAMNHEVDLMLGHSSDQFVELVEEQGLNIINKHPSFPIFNFHSASGAKFKTILRFLSTKKYLREWYEFAQLNWDYDLVILNSSVLCPLSYVFDKLHIKNIIFVRETFRKSFTINKIENIFLKSANAVAYLTSFDQKAWHANNREYVIHDIVDVAMFNSDEKKKKENSTIFLYVGGLSFYKGALDLLKAVYEIKKVSKETSFLVYFLGNTYNEYDKFSLVKKFISYKHIRYRKQCLKYIHEINKDKEIVILKGIQKNIASYYEICDALIFPVKKVHQPKPVYEAGYYGKPVVVPDYDNFKENIKDGYNGYVYKKNDYLSLKESLLEIIDDNNEAQKRGRANKLCTETKHTEASVICLMQNIINDIFKI